LVRSDLVRIPIHVPKAPATISATDALDHEPLALEYNDVACNGGDLIPKKLNQDTGDYTTATGFCTVFNDHLDRLYTLSLLLTANHRKAEQCFVAALDDCLQGNPVFLEWAQPWTTRTVIKNAIRIMSPLRSETDTVTEDDHLTESTSQAGILSTAITRLQPFDRFVFVMSTLEKYSDRECSILLECTVDEVVGARTQALIRLADAIGLEGRGPLDQDPRIFTCCESSARLWRDGGRDVRRSSTGQRARRREIAGRILPPSLTALGGPA
jgi:DNA-directed RNA polymerase specialized sigma24 family protein